MPAPECLLQADIHQYKLYRSTDCDPHYQNNNRLVIVLCLTIECETHD